MRIVRNILIFCLFPIAVKAQLSDKSYSVAIGLSSATVGRDTMAYYERVAGVTSEMGLEFTSKRWRLRSLMSFQQKGYALPVIFVDTNGNVIHEGTLETLKNSYVTFGQTIGVNLNSGSFSFNASTGLNLGFYLNSKVQFPGAQANDTLHIPEYTYVFRSMPDIDLDWINQVELAYRFEQQSIFIQGSYLHGLLNINQEQAKNTIPWQHRTFNVRLGVRYHFDRFFANRRNDRENHPESEDESTP